jgi:hypothetical protein
MGSTAVHGQPRHGRRTRRTQTPDRTCKCPNLHNGRTSGPEAGQTQHRHLARQCARGARRPLRGSHLLIREGRAVGTGQGSIGASAPVSRQARRARRANLGVGGALVLAETGAPRAACISGEMPKQAALLRQASEQPMRSDALGRRFHAARPADAHRSSIRETQKKRIRQPVTEPMRPRSQRSSGTLSS